jgi:hypothetical protein
MEGVKGRKIRLVWCKDAESAKALGRIRKFEARNPKFETNSKNTKFQTNGVNLKRRGELFAAEARRTQRKRKQINSSNCTVSMVKTDRENPRRFRILIFEFRIF